MKKSLGPQPLTYPTPVWAIGTYNEDGQANVMCAAWGGICCSKPPCLAVSLRSATLSHGNISKRKAFTVNIGTEAFASQVDYFGLSTGRKVDKFAATDLTATPSELVDAPYIEEFPLIIECRLQQIVEVGLHSQFIGEIIDVKAEEEILGGDKGLPLIEKLRPLIFSPVARRYHGVGDFIGDAFDMGKKYRQK
ncbi:MAG: flavin reductase family protein [Thermodesulfobacteriota bacterium]